MRFLIRLLGERLARRIEHGSLAVATVGALVGAAAGVGIVFLVEHTRDESIFVHPVTAGILGAFAGALLGPLVLRPRGDVPRAASRPRGALGAVRVTNYNAAVGRIVSSVLFCAAVGGLLYFSLVEHAGWTQPPSMAAGAVVALAGAAFLASRPVLWVEIGDDLIILRKLFATRTYGRDQVRQWGFAIDRRAGGSVPFVLELSDGTALDVVVGPEKVAELESVIAPRAGPTASPAPGTSASPPPGPRR